jgi:hypothetical protein
MHPALWLEEPADYMDIQNDDKLEPQVLRCPPTLATHVRSLPSLVMAPFSVGTRPLVRDA